MPAFLDRPIALAAALLTLALAGCIPQGDGERDGRIEGPVGSESAGITVEFIWPDSAVETGDGLRFPTPDALPLRVRLVNHHRHPVRVRLDDLVMRPYPDPGAGDDSIEAVYPAPGAIRLEYAQARTLDIGSVYLFFGFACTVHVTGEFTPIAPEGEAGAVAVSHDSRPILLDF